MTSTDRRARRTGTRYEYRVWGRYGRACNVLAKLADEHTSERIDECYLLVEDSSFNVKIRENTLKIKRLVAEREGFQQWLSDHHHSADSMPSPFDTIFEGFALDAPHDALERTFHSTRCALSGAPGVHPVFVTKKRRRYRVGALRAESTDILIPETGKTLHTLSIEGDDLARLCALRKRLGLRGEANIAVHTALRRLVSSHECERLSDQPTALGTTRAPLAFARR